MPNLRINGDVQRTFIFPAGIETAFSFYADIIRLVGWLQHIALVRTYADNRLRLLYHTTELGIYGVSLYCDIELIADRAARTIRVQPLAGQAPVAQRATMQNLTAQGVFSSESIFTEHGSQTSIDYALHLEATMPVPLTAQLLIPGAVLGRMAKTITSHRIDEIVEGFIRHSLAAFVGGPENPTPGH